MSLAQNHPFIEGNKQRAFAAVYTFLAINGSRLTADADDAYAFISGLYVEGIFNFASLANVAAPSRQSAFIRSGAVRGSLP
jgi:death-on-curing protein